MPRLSLLAWLIWATVQVAQWSLLAICLRSEVWRRRPAVASFIAERAATSTVLLAVTLLLPDSDLRSAAYYYTFWSSAAIALFLRIWIIAEIASRLSAGPRSRSAVRRAVVALTIALSATSFLSSRHTPTPYGDAMMQAVVTMGRFVSLTWITCFVIMALLGEFFGNVRDRRELLIGAGLCLQAGGELAVAWMVGFAPINPLLSDLHETLYLLSLGLWGWALSRSNLVLSPDTPTMRQLKDIAVPFFHLGHRLRKK